MHSLQLLQLLQLLQVLQFIAITAMTAITAITTIITITAIIATPKRKQQTTRRHFWSPTMHSLTRHLGNQDAQQNEWQPRATRGGALQHEIGRDRRDAHCNREIKVQDSFNMEIM